MEKLKNVQKIVESILVSDPKARDNDDYLWRAVCEKTNPGAINLSFSDVLARRSLLKLPSYKSVERARRKLQANNALLRASEATTDARYEEWKEYREYASEKEVQQHKD